MSYNAARGLPESVCKLVDDFLETTDFIIGQLSSTAENNDNSDAEEVIHRPIYDRQYTGYQFVLDILNGHPQRSYNCFGLSTTAFTHLCDLLVSRGLLVDTKNLMAAEQLAIFLRGVAHAHNYKQLCEFFQYSLKTVVRYFNKVLNVFVSLSEEFINIPSVQAECHSFVSDNPQFYPFFKNAIGAIDGIHISAMVNSHIQNRYRNRKGFTSQNVMAAVSFDRQFVYLAYGWEGSATDMEVLCWTLVEGGFYVSKGKYYLVDSGYANTDRFIAPFRGYRYHLSDFHGETSQRYTGSQELFNHRHAQLRNVVKMTFGIWKKRFQILTQMCNFPVSVQGDIVRACAVLHNYIGRYHGDDFYFNMSQTEMQHDRDLGELDTDDDDPNVHVTIGERVHGDGLRHSISTTMWEELESMRGRQN